MADLIFADDFHTNDYSAWTGSWQPDPSHCSCSAAAGNQAVTVNSPEGVSGHPTAICYYHYTWPATHKVCVKFSFRWTAFSLVGLGLPGSRSPLSLEHWGHWSNRVKSFLLPVVGERTLRGAWADKAESPAYSFMGSGTKQFTLSTTYEIKILVDKTGTNPVVSWWVDGDLIDSAEETSVGNDQLGADGCGLCVGSDGINWEQGIFTWGIDNVEFYDDDPDTGGGRPIMLALLGVR